MLRFLQATINTDFELFAFWQQQAVVSVEVSLTTAF